MERTVDECFFHIQNGANIKQGIVDGGIPITRIETISNDCFNRDKMGFAGITDISKYESYVLEDGDLLMSHINSVQYLGRTVLYEKKGNETIIHGMNLLRLKAKREIIVPAYARYVFYSQPFRAQIARITKKSVNQASFAVTDLKKIRIDVPTLSEQMKVVDLLDRIKKIIDNRNSELSQFDNLIKARFVELFGTPYGNEKGFPLKTVDEVIEFTGGSQPDKKYFEYEPSEGNIRLIQIRDYKTDNYITYIPKHLAKRFCDADDIMIGRYGPPVFQILQGIEGAYNVALMKATPKMGNREFVRYFLKQECLFNYLDGLSQRTAGQSGIEMPSLKAYPFPYPPIELQNQFEVFVKQVDKSKSAVQKALEETQLLFDSLMQKYFG